MNSTANSSNRFTSVAAVMTGYLLVVMVCGGATCARSRTAIPEFNPPPVFTGGTPTLYELVQQTNRSLKVQSVASNSLTITGPDIPKLSGNFRWERPDKFRLETKVLTSALGIPLAAGSNENMFWLQTSRPSPTIFYARHNDFEQQLGPRQFLPISPLWLREAFGIVEMDPQGVHEGPTVRADGKLEVVSLIPSPRGAYRRVLVMDATSGTIEQTLLYDYKGKMIAVASMQNHQYYAAVDWALPHKVQIQLLPDEGDPINFTTEVFVYQFNDAAPQHAFDFPDTTGLTTVDLVRLNASAAQQYSMQNQPTESNAAGYPPAAMQRIAPPVAEPNWQVRPASNSPATGATSLMQNPGVTAPIYRTSTSNQPNAWQDNLRK